MRTVRGPETLLTVITLLHPRRPRMQERNAESVARLEPALTRFGVLSKVQHIRHPMTVEEDMLAAHRALATVDWKIRGEYVLVLDDDDMLVDDGLALDLWLVGRDWWPPMLWYLGWVGSSDRPPETALYPRPKAWNDLVVAKGEIASFNMVARRDLWMEKREGWGEQPGDYHFALACSGSQVERRARLIARTQSMAGRGRPER